jgi:hypothetical protein
MMIVDQAGKGDFTTIGAAIGFLGLNRFSQVRDLGPVG